MNFHRFGKPVADLHRRTGGMLGGKIFFYRFNGVILTAKIQIYIVIVTLTNRNSSGTGYNILRCVNFRMRTYDIRNGCITGSPYSICQNIRLSSVHIATASTFTTTLCSMQFHS